MSALTATPRSAEESCRRQHPRLVRALAVYTDAHDLAEQLDQESRGRADRDWARVGAFYRPDAWAHRVAVNLANSHFRR